MSVDVALGRESDTDMKHKVPGELEEGHQAGAKERAGQNVSTISLSDKRVIETGQVT